MSAKRKELLALHTEKKSLESEAEAIVSELTAVPPGGVSEYSFISSFCLTLLPRTNCRYVSAYMSYSILIFSLNDHILLSNVFGH